MLYESMLVAMAKHIPEDGGRLQEQAQSSVRYSGFRLLCGYGPMMKGNGYI